MLARREYFRAELAGRLRTARRAEELNEEELREVLDEFERKGWLSDERAARQAVNAGKTRYGDARIARAMLARGAGRDTVAQALAALHAGGDAADRLFVNDAAAAVEAIHSTMAAANTQAGVSARRGSGPVGADVADGTEATDENSEAARARAVLRRRFAAAPQDAKQRAKQARFLMGRGFGGALISAILGSKDESEFP